MPYCSLEEARKVVADLGDELVETKPIRKCTMIVRIKCSICNNVYRHPYTYSKHSSLRHGSKCPLYVHPLPRVQPKPCVQCLRDFKPAKKDNILGSRRCLYEYRRT